MGPPRRAVADPGLRTGRLVVANETEAVAGSWYDTNDDGAADTIEIPRWHSVRLVRA